MERLMATPKNDIFADPAHRMPKRPSAIKAGEGVGFQDMGSSLVAPKRTVTYSRTSKNQRKPASTLGNSPRRTKFLDDESDDELLLSSQNSMAGDTSPSPKRVARGKKVTSDKEETVQVNGRSLPAHPMFKPSATYSVKNLRFKKNKNGSADDAAAEVPPPSSSLTDSQDLFKPISADLEILDDTSPVGPSSLPKPSKPAITMTRQGSPGAPKSTTRPLLDAFTSKPSTKETPRSPPKPGRRPRPRVVITSKRNTTPEFTPRPMTHDFPLRTKSPEPPKNLDTERTVKKPFFSSSSRREPQEFPMSLQAKENVSDSQELPSSKAKKGTISRSATFAHAPKPIPLPSPLRTRKVSRGTTFPNLSPLSSQKTKGKARANTPDEDIAVTDGSGKCNAPKPFPMSSHMLADIDRRSKSPSLKSMKRASSDDSDAGRSIKKRKDFRSGVLDALNYLNEPMEDDSIDIGYARDPSKMCPYCDEDLPSHPTPLLQHLLAMARKKSVSDPRPRNRGGLKAPLTIYISVCQRHRFESHQLPIAAKKGWPKTIDFAQVPVRVKRMKKELEAIILDKVDVDVDISDTEGGYSDVGKGPRSKSVFWKEVKKEVKKQGSRAVVGVKGQFASFEKTQPGYYGEQGSVIIHQTLFDLFPLSTFDASLIVPLAPAEFIQRILVPEAAVRLIAEDLFLDHEDAIVTLRESAQYGVAMFPDTNENKRKGASCIDDEMDVADKIVMERARARRKELAEEERVEKEMLDEERAAQRAKARDIRKEKAVYRAQKAKENKPRGEEKTEAGVTESEASEATNAAPRRGTRRQTAVASHSETDRMSVDSCTNERSPRVTKEVRRRGVKTTKEVARSDCSDCTSGSMDLFGDPKPKAKSTRNGTRERSTDPYNRVDTEMGTSRKKPFGGVVDLDSGQEGESTPRPARTLAMDIGTSGTGSGGRILPLQIARNQSGASAPAAREPSALMSRIDINIADNVDSDSSHASQRLDRPRILKKGFEWLLNSSQSSSDSSK